MIKCDLCQDEFPSEMMIIQDNGDVYCKSCDEGVKMNSMSIKSIKKEKNGLIHSNFGKSIRRIFD